MKSINANKRKYNLHMKELANLQKEEISKRGSYIRGIFLHRKMSTLVTQLCACLWYVHEVFPVCSHGLHNIYSKAA